MRALSSVLLTMCLGLAACATAPGRIAPQPSDVSEYRGLSCAALTADETQVQQRLDRLDASQRRTRTIDTIGVALLFLPVGSLTGGDHEREIAELKWRRHVLLRDIDTNQCDSAPASPAPVAPPTN